MEQKYVSIDMLRTRDLILITSLCFTAGYIVAII